MFYQPPLILTALLHDKTLPISQHVPLSGHQDIAFLNDVVNDIESTGNSLMTS